MEFPNNLFSNITIVDKFDNFDIDRNSTSPLKHTFCRSCIKSKNVHTITKLIIGINDMNFEFFLKKKKKYTEIEQIHGRSLNFGVLMVDKIDSELLSASEMFSLIDFNVIGNELPSVNYPHNPLNQPHLLINFFELIQ